MLFGGGRQKKIQSLLTAANEHVKSLNFSEARKAAETAFNLAAEALGDNLSAARKAQITMVHAAVKVGDWAWAQTALERTLRLFEAVGYDLMETVAARRALLDLYHRREHHAEVLALVQNALSKFSDQHPEHAILRALSAPSIAALGRVDEAVGTAKRAFDDANERFADRGPEPCGITSIQLAKVLIETGRDPATGFALVDRVRQKSPARTVDELVGFLHDSHLQALAQIKGENLNEAARNLEITLQMSFKPVWEVGGYPRLLYGKLQGLHGEALAALGRVEEAEPTVFRAIREVEAAAGPRSPDLVPILESYARVLRTKGDARNAEIQEKRAAAIRSLVTGKKVAPVKQEARRAINSIWPRRTLAGVYHLTNVNSGMLAKLVTTLARTILRGSPDDTGFETIPVLPDEAFLVINAWEKSWVPAIAVSCRGVLASLADILELINTGVAAAGGKAVQLEPWVAVRDDLACDWEQWPPAHKEKLLREVFPKLPQWTGTETAMCWLGDGVRLENGRPRHISPFLTVSFTPKDGVSFSGLGPAALLDSWFMAFARATNLFQPQTYSRLAQTEAVARPAMGKPTASA